MAKCKVLPLGWGSPQYQYKLSAEQIEGIPAENLGILVDEYLANTPCSPASCILNCIKGSETSRFREFTLPLNSTEESLVQEWHRLVGVGLDEGHKNCQKVGIHLLWGKSHRWGCSASIREGYGDTLLWAFNTYWTIIRKNERMLLQGLQWQDKGQRF